MKSYRGILITVDNPAFCREKSYELPLMGKSMSQWVSLALGDSPFCVQAGFDEDPVAAIIPALDESKYTVVLYSDTPLVTRRTVSEALQAIETKGEQVLRLTRGWVFETEYLKTLTALPTVPRFYLSDEEDFLTARDFVSLSLVCEAMRQRVMLFHMENGVYIVDPSNTYIDGDVVIAPGVTVMPGNHLRGRTVVSRGVTLEAGNVITDCVIDERARLNASQVSGSYIGADSCVGPYAYLRPDCTVGAGCRIGDYVELKNAKIGDRTKVCHLTYLGDCELGCDCNIGCGVITANYDGKNKFRTVIGDHVFVGSNTTIIAPRTLASGSFIAAGSTLTQDVGERDLAIARARQVNKPDRTLW